MAILDIKYKFTLVIFTLGKDQEFQEYREMIRG